jgi:hypothetical protein
MIFPWLGPAMDNVFAGVRQDTHCPVPHSPSEPDQRADAPSRNQGPALKALGHDLATHWASPKNLEFFQWNGNGIAMFHGGKWRKDAEVQFLKHLRKREIMINPLEIGRGIPKMGCTENFASLRIQNSLQPASSWTSHNVTRMSAYLFPSVKTWNKEPQPENGLGGLSLCFCHRFQDNPAENHSRRDQPGQLVDLGSTSLHIAAL